VSYQSKFTGPEIDEKLEKVDELEKQIENTGGGSDITIDTELSAESENPVQNKVITVILESKLDKDTVGNGTVRLYAITATGEQTTGYTLATSAAACVQPRIPLYFRKDNTQGDIEPPHSLLTATPEKPYHATPKKYVDSRVSSRTGVSANTLYYHIFYGLLSNGGSFEFKVYSNRSEIDIVDNYLQLTLDPSNVAQGITKDMFNVHHNANRHSSNGTINPSIEYEVVGVVEGSDPFQTIYRITKIGNFDFSMVSEISLVATGEV
jgi:hypothetical protein